MEERETERNICFEEKSGVKMFKQWEERLCLELINLHSTPLFIKQMRYEFFFLPLSLSFLKLRDI